MKRILCAAVAVALAWAAPTLLAQETKTHSESVSKSGDTKVKTETVTGTVKEYDAGKKIKISGPGDKTYSFDLDTNAHVEGTIAVGQRAKVVYTKTDGVERVTVISWAPPEAAAAVSEPKSESKAHMESTTKQTSPEGTTKIKSESVIGKVKEFEAGKKIVVTGPKNKDYKFELDEGVSMSGPVSVGERVKVTYTKSDGREKVTVVAPYKGKG